MLSNVLFMGDFYKVSLNGEYFKNFKEEKCNFRKRLLPAKRGYDKLPLKSKDTE